MSACKLEFASKTFLSLSLTHYKGQLEIGDHTTIQENPSKLSILILKGTIINVCNGDSSTHIL